MCLRCSGIHRGLGVHISRVRSIDLDTWTQDQLETMRRWGNRRVNLYWEAHLKPGHMPPDQLRPSPRGPPWPAAALLTRLPRARSKIESFIRSKYEMKRWAMDGPRPEPESLDNGAAVRRLLSTSASRLRPPF